MEILIKHNEQMSWQNELESLAQQVIDKPFSSLAMRFIDAISKSILLKKISRQYPELIAMAHWFRKSQLLRLREEFNNTRGDNIKLARGTALHFAPANVDTLFMYSWLISLLMGNNNIVRLSSNSSEQVDLLLVIIQEILVSQEFESISKRNSIIRYAHDEQITQQLSSICDIRIIWGGGQAVNKIRSISLPAHAKEIVFGDRFSMAAFSAERIVAASNSELNELIISFYNDAFWFDQLACSSPRLIFWIGNKKTITIAKHEFWQRLDSYCEKREIKPDAAKQMLRLTQLFEYAAMNQLIKPQHSLLTFRNFSQIEVNRLSNEMREVHRGGHLFLEFSVEKLNDITQHLITKDQTLSVFGFKKNELVDLLDHLPSRSIDRIVPVGDALTFQATWDGYSLLQEFTREVVLNIRE